jgi:hypothetical protein
VVDEVIAVKAIDEWTDTAYLVIIGGRCPVTCDCPVECSVEGPHKHRIDPVTGEFDFHAERVA